ncbi:hypothetical protein ACWEFL_12205 [Streptomyces sp. NPDC004838]
MASKCLRELIAQSDERGLAASGLACLERCLPLLTSDTEVLRPLWADLADGAEEWSTGLVKVRDALESPPTDDAADDAAAVVRQMLVAAPAEWTTDPLRAWADDCSMAALELHHRFDIRPLPPPGGAASEPVDDAGLLKSCREGEPEGAGPLVTGELRRQIRVLEIVAEGEGGAGLRQALAVSIEGRRVLRAVVSRRARVKR